MNIKIQILIIFLSTTISLSKNLKNQKTLENPQEILERLKASNNQLKKAKVTVHNLLNNKKLPAQEIIKHISQEIGTEYEKEKNKMKLKVEEILNGTYHESSGEESLDDISNDIIDLILPEQSEENIKGENNEDDNFEKENEEDEEKKEEEKKEDDKKDLNNEKDFKEIINDIVNEVNKQMQKEEIKNEEKIKEEKQKKEEKKQK